MMDKSTDMVNLKKLIAMGKNKGYVTFEELNDDLSEEIISSEEQIDDLMMMFEELDIMVIDENTKKKIEERKNAKKARIKQEDKNASSFDLADSTSRISDPVKMYLKEMGRISLLTRDGEVEIAKRIEAGEKAALEALLTCGIGVEHIIILGDRLRETEVKLKDVINDLEDNDNFMQMGEKKESLIHLIDKIHDLNVSIRHKRREMAKRSCSEETRNKLNAQIKEDQKGIMSVVSTFSLEKRQLETCWRVFANF